MPLLTVAFPRGQGGPGQGERAGGDHACTWMEEVIEDGDEEPVERSRGLQCYFSSSDQTPAVQPQQASWSKALRTLPPGKGWHSLAPVGVLWSLSQMEVLLHPSFSVVDVCWMLLLLCLLWTAVGGCAHALKRCLRPGQNQRSHQEGAAGNGDNQHSLVSQPGGLGRRAPLALVLADSLLLCVLQEPLPDPSVPHVHTLFSRLESVSRSLEGADVDSEATLGSALTDKVKLMCTYLQQRRRSLHTLIQMQEHFESSVKDTLEGLDDLWSQLEELHTRVTLTKEGSRRHTDLALAQADAETLFAVLGRYRSKVQFCHSNLKESTQLLQELIWSHAHISNSVSSSGESLWPELLIQFNIEQFDKVQERFLSLEQQTCTFQAHLEGLGKETQEGHTGPLACTNGARSCPATSQASPCGHRSGVSLERRDSTSAPTSASSVDADTDTEAETPLSLCERSALQVSSTIGRLRKTGRRK